MPGAARSTADASWYPQRSASMRRRPYSGPNLTASEPDVDLRASSSTKLARRVERVTVSSTNAATQVAEYMVSLLNRLGFKATKHLVDPASTSAALPLGRPPRTWEWQAVVGPDWRPRGSRLFTCPSCGHSCFRAPPASCDPEVARHRAALGLEAGRTQLGWRKSTAVPTLHGAILTADVASSPLASGTSSTTSSGAPARPDVGQVAGLRFESVRLATAPRACSALAFSARAGTRASGRTWRRSDRDRSRPRSRSGSAGRPIVARR